MTWVCDPLSPTFTEGFQFTGKLQGEKGRKRLRREGGKERKAWKTGERKGRITDFESQVWKAQNFRSA